MATIAAILYFGSAPKSIYFVRIINAYLSMVTKCPYLFQNNCKTFVSEK